MKPNLVGALLAGMSSLASFAETSDMQNLQSVRTTHSSRRYGNRSGRGLFNREFTVGYHDKTKTYFVQSSEGTVLQLGLSNRLYNHFSRNRVYMERRAENMQKNYEMHGIRRKVKLVSVNDGRCSVAC